MSARDPGPIDSPRGTGLFAPTRWSLVRSAAADREALGDWIGLYWYPLYAWARHKGSTSEDAADSVQGFLEKLCERGLLAQADPSRGKLRSWLLTSFANHLASAHRRDTRLKRGGGAVHLSIDWNSAESAYQADHPFASDAEALYARTWALTLMEEALDRLAEHFRDSGREALFEALLPALESPLPDSTYAEIAPSLGMSPAALRQAAVRFRQRYRRALLEIAARRLGISCEVRLQTELRELLGG